MSHLQCCGLNNYTDFLDAKKFTSAAREEGIGRKIPEACCFLQEDDIFSLLPVDDNCVISPTTKNSYLFKVRFDMHFVLMQSATNSYILFKTFIYQENQFQSFPPFEGGRDKSIFLLEYIYKEAATVPPIL